MGVIWDGLLGGVIGAVVGSLLTILYERTQRRCEIAIGLIEQFHSNYAGIGDAMDLMQNVTEQTDLNPVRKIGDWYETCAALCIENVAKGALLKKVGIDTEMRRFYESASAVSRLNDAVKLWRNMRDFCKG